MCGIQHSNSESRDVPTHPVSFPPSMRGDKVQDLESPHTDLAHLESFLIVLLYARYLEAAEMR
jgi:hypothetical protein